MWDGEVTLGVKLWFARRIRAELDEFRDYEDNGSWLCGRLSDPDIFEWVAEWYCDHIRTFLLCHDQNTFRVDDIHNDERVKFREQAVGTLCRAVVRLAEEALPGRAEAVAYPDLDSWLAALAGKLAWDGPKERAGYAFVADPRRFVQAQRRRRMAWPRTCTGCGGEFKPDRDGLKNCLDCRQAKRLRRCSP